VKTCVIIPAYNEAKSIADTIKRVHTQNMDVLVIDDGSLDNSALIAEENGAIVLRNMRNKGKGASLIKGFNYCLSKGYDAVITMDGDGQHLPEEIPLFINSALGSSAGIFIGNRMTNKKNMPFVRILTNKLMSWFLSKITKQIIPDTQCGFRLIKKEVLEKINFVTSKYETESEILIKGSRLSFKIESIPINTIYIGGKSSINPVVDALRFIGFIIKELRKGKAEDA
jgi:glycosyltransferase involved in cell wall biosynthesis